MNKKIDLKNRVVDIFDCDNTGDYEDEIIGYLDKKMKVRFHAARFNNNDYVFLGNSKDHFGGSITVSSYRKKRDGEDISVLIG